MEKKEDVKKKDTKIEELEKMECTPIRIAVGDKKINGYACKVGDSVSVNVVSKEQLKYAVEDSLKKLEKERAKKSRT